MECPYLPPLSGIYNSLWSVCCRVEKANLKGRGDRNVKAHWEGWHRASRRGSRVHQDARGSSVQAREQVLDVAVDANACCLEEVRAQPYNDCVMAIFTSNAFRAKIGGVVTEVGV
eukprot:GFKZ01004396.1.p3 GENE.GFKZ01004396.1~~GFKZ01004396.1.p3  ORF type:complete len:115 (-),score=7.18 GFKZ01004396.1:309-653(-)